ncbi:MAG: carboxypeptidase-like regulatory domain-containing protein, partial [Bacteroidota bacterium]
INEQLPDDYWDVSDDDQTSPIVSNVFSRELAPPDQSNGNVEETLIEIGKKSALARGSSATLAGYVKEKATGESIVGAVVYTETPFRSVVTNEYGFYSLNLSKGPQLLKVRYAGMKEMELKVMLYEDGKLDISMEDAIISLKEITVESDKEENVLGLQTGLEKLDVRAMKNIPKILGENDIIKVTLALPGVQTVGEAALGFNVRGGASDQNLILLNEAPIYNPSHFLGFFSVFNADVIKSSQLYKSGIPVRFGGRLSSVLEVQLKEGNKKKFSGQGGISPITSRLSFEIPVVRDKSSLILGARSTYSDWVLNQVPDESIRNSDVLFYDLVARYSHQINPNNSIFVSGYYSKDRFRLSTDT